MKKLIIISVNIIVLCSLFFILNIYFEKNVEKINNRVNAISVWGVKDHFKYTINEEYVEDYPPDFERIERTEEKFAEYCNEDRYVFGEQYKDKKPIAVLGCSYAYGHGLKKEESFSYLLSELTKRPVYNFSFCGGNLQENFFLINLNETNKARFKEAEYVIYVYMHDHINRYLIQPAFMNNEETIVSTGIKKFLYENIFIIKYIFTSIKLKKLFSDFPNPEKNSLYLKELLKSTYKKLKQNNPNVKFMVVVYNEKLTPDKNVYYLEGVLNSHIWKDLAQETDIDVVETKDVMGFLFNKDYKLKADIADWHPNARVWKELTPKIAERITNT